MTLVFRARSVGALIVLMVCWLAAPTGAQPQAVQYTYDSLNRLTAAQYPDRLVRYTYDPAGNRVLLSIQHVNPVPTITTLVPTSALVGGTNLSITVSGTGFVDTSIVNWNGGPRPTTFVSATELTAAIDAADVAAQGTADIAVTTPGPGGGTTTTLQFSILAACTYALSPGTQAVAAAGGVGSASLTAPTGCAWTATADRSWIAITSAASGAGSTTVSYSVGVNPSSLARSGHISVGGETLTINQAGAACAFTVTAAPASFTSAGGAGVASVTAAPQDCSWTALANAPWLTFSGAASGTGDGAVNFDVAPNPVTASRIGSLSAGGQTITVDQAGRPVTLTLTLAGSGSGRVVSVPAGIDCGTACAGAFVVGQQVALTATPAPGSLFDVWTGDPDCADGVVTLDADVQCTATFLADTVGNPVPFINNVAPLTVMPGSTSLVLILNGANFHTGSLVRWNSVDYAPSVATGTRLEALIPATELLTGTTASVTVWTPGPGGGLSNQVFVHIAVPSPGVQFLESTIGTGAEPVAVASSDINDDGRVDIVSANLLASSVSVALGNGHGTFGPRADYSTGTGPSGILIADLNRDGRIDLVTTNVLANTLSVLLGNGDGTFGEATDVPTGVGPFAGVTADLNADGALDLVVASDGLSAASVLLGRGDGTFTLAAELASSSPFRGIVAGDFDGDGRLDVAMTEAGGAISMFPGLGDGSFGAKASFAAGAGARGLARGDFNGDGIVDLIVANELDGTVSILPGLITGGFGPRVDVAVGNNPRAAVTGDFNADGRLDAIVTNTGSGSVSVLLGNGNGTFAPRLDFVVGAAPVALDTADFDRDGRLDVAVANQSLARISVLVGRLPAGVTIAPAAVDFGQQAMGMPTAHRTISITNTGASPLVVSSVVVASGAVAQFEVVTDTCSDGTFGPNDSCVVTVRYLATAAGVSTASLQVNSNAPGAPHLVALMGEAVQGAAISSFTPTSGAPGMDVTVTGTALGESTAVEFNGLTALFVVNSSSSITTTVPVGATSGPIRVTTPLNTATSAASFRVAPRITSLSPDSGAVGVTVTIAGANFTEASAVLFNGTAAAFVVNSTTQMTATVPGGATTGPVTVTTPAGTATSTAAFVVAPRITGIAPSTGPAGTTVTIDGANFTGVTAVTFNGQAASFTVTSATRLNATVPASATTGPVAVTTSAGTAVSQTTFTVTFAPMIANFSPMSGAPGTAVTITGANFSDVRDVRFDGTKASYVVTSSTQIVATVPGNATSGPIVVTTAVASATSVSSFLLAPSISSVAPTAGPVMASVTVRGSNFTGAVGVAFNGVPAAFTVVSDARISAQVPLTASTGTISVTTPGGVAVSATVFVVQASISGVLPATGDVGTAVQIVGSAFTGVSDVRFNGVVAAYVVNSSTQLTATVPSGATSGPITVTTSAGTATSPVSFTVSPRIAGFTPTSGAPGTKVTISGANFTAATAVTFNGVAATFSVNSSTRITARVPAGATAGPIAVTTPAGTATSSGTFTP